MPSAKSLAIQALQHFILAMVYGVLFCLVAYCFIG